MTAPELSRENTSNSEKLLKPGYEDAFFTLDSPNNLTMTHESNSFRKHFVTLLPRPLHTNTATIAFYAGEWYAVYAILNR